MPEVRNGEVPIKISDDGFAKISVKDRDTLRIAIDELTDKFDYFSTLLGEMTERCNRTARAAAGESVVPPVSLEGGFSDAP